MPEPAEFHPDPAAEARDLLRVQGGPERLRDCLSLVSAQLQVMQTRTQTLLGLATLCITVTGFSGPKIAASNPFSRATLAAGLFLTLVAVLLLLFNLRVRWITQFAHPDPEARLAAIIAQRDQRTARFLQQIGVLGLGLACYVASVIGYLVAGDP